MVEIEGARLVKVLPDGRKEVVAELGGGPNGAAMGPGNKVYVCNNGGSTGSMSRTATSARTAAPTAIPAAASRPWTCRRARSTLLTHCGDVPLTGPNDIVFDGKGGFWFTDHGKSYDRLMDRGAVFYASEDGSFVTEVAFPLITANGVGISPDGETLYASETETGRVWASADPRSRRSRQGALALAQRRQVHRQRHRLPALQFDGGQGENGNICVATLVNAGISVFSPDGRCMRILRRARTLLHQHRLRRRGHARTAYITLSGYGTLVAVDWPRAGLG